MNVKPTTTANSPVAIAHQIFSTIPTGNLAPVNRPAGDWASVRLAVTQSPCPRTGETLRGHGPPRIITAAASMTTGTSRGAPTRRPGLSSLMKTCGLLASQAGVSPRSAEKERSRERRPILAEPH